jgi:VCBS repeat-containing protein
MSDATFDLDSLSSSLDGSFNADGSLALGTEERTHQRSLPVTAVLPPAPKNTIIGTNQGERLRGTGKADRIEGRGGNDVLLGRGGDDHLIGGRGKDRLKGGKGNDYLEGGRGADRLFGNDGDDVLIGGGGNDLLRGGRGNDTIHTGRGRDTVVLAPEEGTDTILDFKIGKDQIKLLKRLTFADLTLTASGRSDTAIVVTSTGETLAILKNIRPNQLNAADFGEKNEPPVGVDDQIVVVRGETATLLNSGETSVLANDRDPEGAPLTALLVDSPRHASNFQFNADGSFVYTHNGSQNLSDRFTYRASDGNATSKLVTVSVTVMPTSGNPPVAVDDRIVVKEGGTANRLTTGSTRLTDNDTDPDLPGDVLTVETTPVVAPAHGTVQLNPDGTFLYTHDGSETLTDSFVYALVDSIGLTDTATVFITIEPVNDPPVITVNTSIVLLEGGQQTITVAHLKATDVDSPDIELVYTVTGAPLHGRLELTSKPGVVAKTFTQADINANRLIYIHNNSNTIADSFTFSLSDGGKDGTLPVTGTFNIQITPVIDFPVAVADAVSVGQGGSATQLDSGAFTVLANDILGESDTLTAILVDGPLHGSLTLNADGTFSYTHNGSENFADRFTYQVSDGLNLSEPVEVAIAITPFNKAPVNILPGQQTTDINTALFFTQGKDNLIQVSDPDAGATPIQVRLQVSAGTLTLSGVAGLTFLFGDGVRDQQMVMRGSMNAINAALDGLSYNPPRDFIGTVSLTVTTDDLGNTGIGGSLTDTDILTIIVGSASDINNAPVNIVPGNQTTPQTTELVFQSSTGNAIQVSDPDAGDAPVQVQLSVTSGTLSLSTVAGLSFTQGNGVNNAAMVFTGTIAAINTALEGLRYTPIETFEGTVTLTILTNDLGNTGIGGSQSDQDQVAIAVTRVNRMPLAEDDVAETEAGVAVQIDVLSNDSDSDGSLDVGSVAIAIGPANGTVSINSETGVITYTPNTGFSGIDTFTYTVADNEGLVSEPATVTVTVISVNAQPVAVDDAVTTDEDVPIDINVLANDTDPDGDDTLDPTSVAIVDLPANGTVTINPETGVITYMPNENFNGTDSFTYTVADIEGSVSDPATVTITINPVNDQPIAVDDAVTTDEDVPIDINVLANDTDPDGDETLDPTSVTIVDQPANGTVTVNPETGVVTYTPNENFNGTDSFTYTVADNEGLVSEPATVTITINPVNDQPIAVDDAVTTDEDVPIDINVLANDTDPDGDETLDPTSVTIVDPPANGTVTVNPETGVVTYTPNENFNGTDSFTYTVADNEGLVSEPATVTITINPVNDQPIAVDDAVTTDEDVPIDINVLANDTDPDGDETLDPTSVTIVDQPANGTVVVNPETGVVTYTPNENFNGTDSFTYTVADNEGLVSEPATVTITVNSVNDEPIAQDDTAQTPRNQAVVINVLENDTDVDGTIDPTSVVIVDAPQKGSVSVNPETGEITYTPNDGVFGIDTFTYTVQDNEGAISNVATVTVQIGSEPLAQDDAVTTAEDTPIDINVLENDEDDGVLDPTTVTIVDPPTHGTVTVNPETGVVTYTPNENFNGTDSFTYTVSDDDGLISTPATVTITVTPVNDQPIAVDDAVTTDEDIPIDINVLANDTDPDGDETLDPTSVTIVDPPTNGTVVVNPETGVVTYTPNENFNGTDSFTYTVADNEGLVSEPATVTITINPVNDQPIAVDDAVTTDEDVPIDINVLANDTDPDGDETLDPTSVTIVDPPTNGTVVVNPETGVVTYTPNENFNGTDSFTYTVADNEGLVSEPATVTITINPVNDQPIAVDDAVTTDEDVPVDINVLANDTDPDGDDTLDPTSVTIVDLPANGTVTVNPETGVVTYTPNENFNGTDSFTYTVADNEGLVSEPATVTITINPVNDDPIAQDDSFATSIDTLLTGNVLADNGNGADSDPDGDTLTVIQVNGILLDGSPITLPSGATLTVNSDGSFTYTPSSSGTDSFTYTISDGNGGIATATVTIAIAGGNTSPTAQDDFFETDEITAFSGNLFENNGNGIDLDPDGDPFTVTAVNGVPTAVGQTITLPSGAVVQVNGDGMFDYNPNGAFAALAQGDIGIDSFTYTITDDKGKSDTALVTIEIAGLNSAPITQNNAATTNEDTPITIDVLANDIDPDDGDILRISGVNTAGTQGQVSITSDNQVFYDPRGRFDFLAEGQTATDTFSYTAIDSFGATSTATVTLTITGVNDAPIVRNDSAVTFVGQPVVIDVLANDFDVDGTIDPSSIEIVMGVNPAKGSITVNPNGTITYTPNPGVESSDSFSYTVRDDKGKISETAAMVNVFIVASDGNPVAIGDEVTINEGETVTIDLIANDFDDGFIDPESIEIIDPPAFGTLTLNGDGTVTYTPTNPNNNQDDAFNYRVYDDEGNPSNVATVNITINAINDPPVNTFPAEVETVEGTPFVFSGANQISVDDVDITNPNTTPLTVTLSVTNGTLTLSSTTGLTFPNGGDGVNDSDITIRGSLNALNNALAGLTYTPAEGFSGAATLIITTSDRINSTNEGFFGLGGPQSTTDTLTITVQPINKDPIARDDLFTISEDSVLTGDVLRNNGNGRDRDPDGDPLVVAQVNGDDTAIGAPVTLPSGALLTLNEDGTFAYDPNGAFDSLTTGEQATDTFTYTISDGRGGTATASVIITIDGLNNAPVVGTNLGLTVKKEGEATLTADRLNEADPDSSGAQVTYVITAAPGQGYLAFADNAAIAITEFTQADIDANRVIYVHTTDSIEPDSFTFFLRDQEGLTSDPASFAIDVTTLNLPPILDLDSDNSSGATGGDYIGRFNEGSGGTAIADTDLSITDSDDSTLASMTVTLTNRPDGDSNEQLFLTTEAEAIATSLGLVTTYDMATGVLTIVGRAAISQYETILRGIQYNNTALTDVGDRIITVIVDDGFDTTTATSTLLMNRAPTVGDNLFTGINAAVGNTRFTMGSRIGDANSPEMVVSGSLLDNDFDADGHEITVVSVDNGFTLAGGLFTVNADGTFTYLPPLGFTGSDTFSYTVVDEFGATATGTVSIAVDDLVWYVSSSAPTGGTGYANSPFRTLDEVESVARRGEYIYIYGGSNLTGSLTLRNNQVLLGAGTDLTVSNDRTILAAGGGVSQINNTSDDVIILGRNNTIRGLTLGGLDYSIRDGGGTVGTLTISDVKLTSGFQVANGGTLAVSLDSFTGDNLFLQGVGGTLIANNVDISVGFGLQPIELFNNTASITLNNVNILTSGTTAIASSNGGNLTVTNGSVSVFNFGENSDVIRIDQTSGTATVTLQNLTINGDLGSIGSSGFGLLATAAGTGTLNLDAANLNITSLAIADIRVVQQGDATFALRDFAGDGTLAAEVIAYLESRNPGSSADAILDEEGFTSF